MLCVPFQKYCTYCIRTNDTRWMLKINYDYTCMSIADYEQISRVAQLQWKQRRLKTKDEVQQRQWTNLRKSWTEFDTFQKFTEPCNKGLRKYDIYNVLGSTLISADQLQNNEKCFYKSVWNPARRLRTMPRAVTADSSRRQHALADKILGNWHFQFDRIIINLKAKTYNFLHPSQSMLRYWKCQRKREV